MSKIEIAYRKIEPKHETKFIYEFDHENLLKLLVWAARDLGLKVPEGVADVRYQDEDEYHNNSERGVSLIVVTGADPVNYPGTYIEPG